MYYSTDSLTPQALVVLKAMKKAGYITQRSALMDHSIQSLTRRISEINAICIAVVAERCKHPETGQRYTRYKLKHPHLVAG